MEKFSGVHVLGYYQTGDDRGAFPRSVVHSDKIYRHPDLQQMVVNAFRLRFTVYNFDISDVIAYIEFKPKAGDGLEEWFHWDRVHYSSLWQFSRHRLAGKGDQFTMSMHSSRKKRYEDRVFYINQKWTGCKRDAGWFMAKSDHAGREAMRVRDGLKNTKNHNCKSWENWWTYEQAKQVGECQVVDRYQPPAFLYSPTKKPIRYHQNKAPLAGMITIEVASTTEE